MKMRLPIISALVLMFIVSSIQAQIPNFSFENWTSMGTYSNPTDWGTMNNTTASTNIFTATKATPGNPGSSYLKLTSKTVGASVVTAIAVSGVLDSITKQPISGFAFNQRPASFTGKWQYMYTTTPGLISVKLTRWNSVTHARETVANASKTLTGMVMSWDSFNINLTYLNGNYPDTCIDRKSVV